MSFIKYRPFWWNHILFFWIGKITYSLSEMSIIICRLFWWNHILSFWIRKITFFSFRKFLVRVIIYGGITSYLFELERSRISLSEMSFIKRLFILVESHPILLKLERSLISLSEMSFVVCRLFWWNQSLRMNFLSFSKS